MHVHGSLHLLKQFGHVIEGLIVIRIPWMISIQESVPRTGTMTSPIRKEARKWKINLALRIDHPEDEAMRRSAEQ